MIHWAYYLVIALLVAYFLSLFLYGRYKRKKGIPPSCDCGGKGKMLLANYHLEKAKEERRQASKGNQAQ